MKAIPFTRTTPGDLGFVVHGITGPFKSTVSAWFEPDAVTLKDAEQLFIDRNGARPVKRNGPIWDHAKQYGKAAIRHWRSIQG